MGVKIILKCDLCPAADESYTWGEDPGKYGWEANRNYCLCPACNKEAARQESIMADGDEEK